MGKAKTNPVCEIHGLPKRQNFKKGARGSRVRDGWRCTACQTEKQ